MTFSALNIAAAGMSVASSKLAITAGNIANMESAGYKARRANLSASPGGAVVGSVTTDPTPGAIDADGQETSNVDPVTESIALIQEKHQYTASAKLFKAADQMLGTLLDVMK